MSETSDYKHGDIAWVKLGNCWWPGEVIEFDQLLESVKEEFQASAKNKLPLAFVKFFQEDSYEYVKKSDKIFPYNCARKDEFIKKGMDMHRAKKSNMEKFPEDVVIAEKRTDGNEKILEDDKYGPPKKPEHYADLFGTPKAKNSPKQTGRGRSSLKSASPVKRSTPQHVTHPRFIGQSTDHRRTVLMQPKKEETKENTYKCSTCGFSSSRIDAIVLHNKTHVKSDSLFNDVPKKGKKSPAKRAPRKSMNKIPTSKTNTIDEDLALLERGLSLTDGELPTSDAETTEKKRKKKRKRAPTQENPPSSNKKPAPDITNDLLAEWDDMDDDAEEENKSMDESMNDTLDPKDKSIEDLPKLNKVEQFEKAKSPRPSRTPKADKKANKSQSTPTNTENGAKIVDATKDEFDFTSLLETTKVPDVPSLPTTKGDEVKEVATKLTNPKKRFVKSFEDFELSMKEKEQEKEKEVQTKPDSDEKVDETRAEVEEAVESKVDEEKLQSREDKAEETEEETQESTKNDEEQQEEEVVEKKKEEIVEDRKTRRSSARIEKEKVEEKPIEPPPRKSTRRSEVKPVVKAVEEKPVEEKEQKVEDKLTKGKKDEAKSAEVPETEPEKLEKEAKSPKKIKEDPKVSTAKKEIEKAKKEEKMEKPVVVAVVEEEPKAAKKETKPVTEEKEKEKIEKSEKKVADQKSKEKPKEQILSEFDLFGSLRAQENEKYHKKSEDSPRRETRASRSKSRSESSQEKKTPLPETSKVSGKRAKKDELSLDEAQVNNGKNEDVSSPLIFKMKNKLMNMLNTEPGLRSPKSRKQRMSVRSSQDEEMSASLDEEVVDDPAKNDLAKIEVSTKGKGSKVESKKEAAKDKEDKKEVFEKEDKKDVKDKEEKKETLKSPEPTRRHSLRNTPLAERTVSIRDDKEKEEKVEVEKKKMIPTKAEVKAAVHTRMELKSGPKTYLRASRSQDRIEADIKQPIAVKSPLSSPKAETKAKAVPPPATASVSKEEIVKEKTMVDKMETEEEKLPEKVVEEKPDESSPVLSMPAEVKKTKSIDKLDVSPVEIETPEDSEKELESSDMMTDSNEDETKSSTETNTVDWLKTLSPIQKKIIPVEELPSKDENEEIEDDSDMSIGVPVSPVKTPLSPSKTPVSPIKAPASPTKTPGSPTKAPGSPAKAPGSPMKAQDSSTKAPGSSTKTLGSPVKAPGSPTKTTSPMKSPGSPVKTPASPAKAAPAAPLSPVKAPASPIKTPSSPMLTRAALLESPIKSPPMPIKSVPSPMKSPPSPMKSPQSPMKSPPSPMKSAPSPIKSPPSPVKQSPMKSPPIILNKDAPKFEPPKKLQQKKEDEVKVVGSIKSPRRISLTSQEVSIEKITDKVEITVNNNESNDVELEATTIEHSLDLLASVSSLNKDVLEKNVTVVPEDIFAEGQVEIATIIEGGTEKVASVPNVIQESKVEIQTTKMEETAVPPPAVIAFTPAMTETMAIVEDIILENKPAEKEVEKPAAPISKSEPIILNSRFSADQESTSKLLDILTDNKRTVRPTVAKPPQQQQQQQVPLPKVANPKFEIDTKKHSIVTTAPKQGRILTTATISTPGTSKSKPTILSDTLIKSATPVSDSVVSVQKLKRASNDIEDIDTFIITKHAKKSGDEHHPELKKVITQPKTKLQILDHTIVTAAGQMKKQPIVHHQTVKVASGTGKTVEEKVYELLNSPKSSREDDTFDIDSMPIVLSDQLLTSDAIESMSIVQPEPPKKIQTVQQIIRKPIQQKKVMPSQQQIFQAATTVRTTPTTKTYTKVVKGQRVYQTSTPTMLKHSPTIISQGGKPGKFVIVPSQSSTPTGSKYTVGKRQQQVIKKPAILAGSKVSHNTGEPTGNKIMIVTNNQGQQSRVLLTPEHQKLMGYQTQVKKTIVKGISSPMQAKDRSKLLVATSSPGSGLMQVKKPKMDPNKRIPGQKFCLQGALPPLKGPPGQTRTVIIKNQQGEIVNRIHGTCDEDIEKQVAEQLEAINRAATAKAQAQMKGTTTMKRIVKKTVQAPLSDSTRTALQNKAMNASTVVSGAAAGRSMTVAVPPLAPISPVKKMVAEQPMQKQIIRHQKVATTSTVSTAASSRVAAKVEAQPPTPAAATKAVEKPEPKEDRPPKQLVIQDAMGNETTIMEGQILALPSETVDGQPQSYMLVTLDESGSLTPLNNEALMSLDPNLNLGGDMSNMVLQIEGGGAGDAAETVTTQSPTMVEPSPVVAKTRQVAKPAPVQVASEPQPPVVSEAPATMVVPQEQEEVAAQTQLQQADVQDSEGPTEQMHAVACSINKGDTQQQLIITGDPIATQKFLESLSEGNAEIANLLAQAEGNNILIHTDGQQILINTDADNPMLMSLNQEGEAIAEGSGNPIFSSANDSNAKIQDILAAALADTDVIQQEQAIAAVKVTQSQVSPGYPMAVNNVFETSTVNSPIMTPLEVPSANSKKLNTDVLNQVPPKNVDLPITITDPNIAQSVANQQVAMMARELSSSLELPLTIQDVPTTSTSMNSPSSFSYSLPSLDDGDKFTSPISMPLLTEDPEEVQTSTASSSQKDTTTSTSSQSETSSQDSDSKSHESTAEYLLATGDMCSISNQLGSLSEPPQDMFDFPMEQGDVQFCNSSEEIPTQSSHIELVSKSPKRGLDDDATDDDANKRSKLD